jgi:PAS domain S-box-containing protein
MTKPTYDEPANRLKAPGKKIVAETDGSMSRQSACDFQTFTEQSPNMIFINQGGRVVYVNKRCAETMGYSRDEFYAPEFDFISLIAPESVGLIQANFKRHLAGEDIEPYEYSILTRKGQKIQAIITTRLINFEGARAILGIITDITDRKRAEEELRYRLEFQRLITTISSRFINLYPAQIDDEIDRTLQQIANFANADRSYVFQFSDDQKSISCTHEWCADQIEPLIGRLRNAPVDTFPWILKKHLRGEMVLIPRVSDLPSEAFKEKQEFMRQGIQSLLVVPMICSNKVMGFIGLDSVKEEKMWAGDTNSLLKIVGQVFANALENKKTRQALQQSEERLRIVFETFPDYPGGRRALHRR